MLEADTLRQTIVRTERGLSIAGTRITLYNVMDYLEANWPPSLIQNWLNLTEGQLADAMGYIAEHREEVEAEYRTVLQHAQRNRAYWESRNQERLRKISEQAPDPEQKAIQARIEARKSELGLR
ncbi:MAG TPA: DUF433 domain-containing protein [Blastocatellia bacterium]|nr:DUF433 domain-containing protein [Blastocatellia bacterium]